MREQLDQTENNLVLAVLAVQILLAQTSINLIVSEYFFPKERKKILYTKINLTLVIPSKKVKKKKLTYNIVSTFKEI